MDYDSKNTGRVTVVGAGAGIADLMPLRAVKRLLQADVVIFDPDVSDLAYEYAGATAKCIGLGEGGEGSIQSSDEVHALLIRHARAGKRVVHLRNGTLSGAEPVSGEMAALRNAGLNVDVVPGVAASAIN